MTLTFVQYTHHIGLKIIPSETKLLLVIHGGNCSSVKSEKSGMVAGHLLNSRSNSTTLYQDRLLLSGNSKHSLSYVRLVKLEQRTKRSNPLLNSFV